SRARMSPRIPDGSAFPVARDHPAGDLDRVTETASAPRARDRRPRRPDHLRTRAMAHLLLTSPDQNALLAHYRRSTQPPVRLRSHILLLLDAGHPWATISAVLFCSVSTISRWKRRYEKEGVNAVIGRPRGRRKSGVHAWATLVVRWVLTCSPVEFRFARSRWSC